MNIETAITKAYLELKKNNNKTPQLDCELIMSKVLKKDRKFIILNLKKKTTKSSLWGI